MLKYLLSFAVCVCLCGQVLAGPSNVLIVQNTRSADSRAITAYYASKRHIASKYICSIACPYGEYTGQEYYDRDIAKPIKEFLIKNKLKDKIDYIVTTRGVPLVTGDGWCVDSLLVGLFMDYTAQTQNPYFNAKKHFSHKEYGIYLVTRLDSVSLDDAKALVDRSLAAKPLKGLFLLDLDPGRDLNEGYRIVNDGMRRAAVILKKRGFQVELNATKDFVVRKGLMGYYSWARNDGAFTREEFLKLRFEPGSIAEIADSWSAQTLTAKRPEGRRAFITDMVAGGVTGVKGYVKEPYASALAVGDILFGRYTDGYNLAESFYAASYFVHWRDVVLGDPLCNPYAKKGK